MKMKGMRVVYAVLLVASLGLSSVLYYHYQLKDEQLLQYQSLLGHSGAVLKEIGAQLTRSKKELEQSLKEKEELNKTISDLEKHKLEFKGELQALKGELEEERKRLEAKISRLIDENTILESSYLVLKERFHSLQELKNAIRIAKIEEGKIRKVEKIKRRLAAIEMLKRLDEIALQHGNRGFIVEGGIPTFKPRTKVKVELERVE